MSKLTVGSGCWTFAASTDKDGYPQFSVAGQPCRASRFVYEMVCDPIPTGHVIRHDCDNPACVNPYHMRTGTLGDNNRDRAARGRSRKPYISHCAKCGTEYTVMHGGRRCPRCRTAYIRGRLTHA